MKRHVILTIAAFTGMISCKKSNTDVAAIVYPKEATYQNFIADVAQNSTLQSVTNASQFFENGVAFKTLVTGQIKTLYVKIPDTSAALLITIWDKTTQAKIFQTTVAIAISNTEKAVDISPIVIEKNKEYVISIRTNDYYLRKKTGGTLINYPFISGNVIYTATMNDNASMQAFPNVYYNQGSFFSEVYFKFQQTQ
jgi:hypothetical protein